MKLFTHTILFSLMWLATTKITAQTTATVVRVVDGDTYQMLKGKRIFTVRLLNVDAPEATQSFGEAAKDSVSQLILGKTVVVDSLKLDRYNRVLASVTINGKALDSIMVSNGWAWHYVEYSNKPELATMQEMAINKHFGLWKCGTNKVCPPSVFRKLNARNRAKYCKGCIN
ncbi:MAG: thermonuclease family protein [Bacteroidetes bacterium]|nr:thermonuclease family protein [Bacteroidota bacterium]MBS1670898.1 thermonuclease family protein [Bacteroidota bacterium]